MYIIDINELESLKIRIEKINPQDHFYHNFYLTFHINQLDKLSKKYPAALIIFCTDKKYNDLPDNVFIISPPFEKNISNQINNLLFFEKKIKEAYLRKILLNVMQEKNLNTIKQFFKNIGFNLMIYHNLKSRIYKKILIKLNKSKKSYSIIFNKQKLFGFYLINQKQLCFFKSIWSNDTKIHHDLLKDFIENFSKIFNINHYPQIDTIKNQFPEETRSLTIKQKEDILSKHIGEGLFITDLNYNIIFINNRFCELIHLNKYDILGKNLNQVLNVDIKVDLIKNRQNKKNQPVKTQIKTKKQGKIRYYHITYSSFLENGKITSICGIIRDITKEKIMENRIKFTNIKSILMNKKLLTVQNAIILGFSKLSEYKDKETGGHLERIQNYVKLLAFKLYKDEVFLDFKSNRNYLSESYIAELSISSLLHDIGKVGIPDHILLKPTTLTKDEYNYMQTHTKIGGDTLKYLHDTVGEKSFLSIAKEIAYYHHEKWNGTGYPYGLQKQQIPISARITAICDVYDALSTERPYKKAYSHEKSCEIIYNLSNSQFDPVIVSAFSSIERKINLIRKKYS